MKRLIAIDGNSLMHRAYYALPGMTTVDGFPTGALHGFISMLLKLTQMNPDYLVVAFDMHMPTFRHETFDAYKAGRKETPEDLRTQFPILKDLLIKMGIAVCECPRYEADDILGTFAKLCESAGVFSLLVTGDRDAFQLIDDHTHVLITKKGISDTIEYDRQTLLETYGLSPDHMRDLKGLMGDNSDNIPGIPGVGEKTALKLLEQYGTIDAVLAHAGEVKGKLGEKLIAYADSARMSYQLGTICTAAPISLGIADCMFVPSRMSEARTQLNQLELRSIATRLPVGEVSSIDFTDAPSFAERLAIDTSDALQSVIRELKNQPILAIDAGETVSFAASDEREYRISQGGDLFSTGLDPAELLHELKPFFEDATKKLLVFDSKRFRHILNKYAIMLKCSVFDAMIADYLLNAIRPAGSLAALAAQSLHQDDAGAAALFTLEPVMMRALETAEMLPLYQNMEMPLSNVLFEMEIDGFYVDEPILLSLQTQFGERLETLTAEIYGQAGEQFNILSPKQLGEVLFNKLELPTQRKIKSGFSTDADTLEALADRHPIVPRILEYRFLSKLKSTFVDGLLNVRSTKDGRVRTSLNQCITATGRISSTEPNLQNIPVRTEQGREIRKAFVASPGNVLVGADYSQIELRLLAHISGDQNMINAFNSGEDIHRRTAGEVFGVPFDEVTNDLRSAAKAVNFGIVYGISDFGLAKNLGIPVKQATEYIQLYFKRYPRVKAYLDESIQRAKEAGYARTLFDRRRALPEISSSNYNTRSFGERVAMNMPIQGTAADIIKLAMVNAATALRKNGLKAKLILQVHDELIFDTPEDEVSEVMRMVHDCMEHVITLSVPLAADVKTGHSWYDTK
ncbi:MAG: DNA polymerase I [Clostridia bacterium]